MTSTVSIGTNDYEITEKYELVKIFNFNHHKVNKINVLNTVEPLYNGHH